MRVVVLGRGGAGMTTAARRLGELLRAPVIELDRLFWSVDLEPTPPARWAEVQVELAAGDWWVMDGDLGPCDVVEPRLARADTVIVLDFNVVRCLWRSVRRSRERLDFWWWVITWRRTAKPRLLAAVAAHARHAQLHVLHHPRQLTQLLTSLGIAGDTNQRDGAAGETSGTDVPGGTAPGEGMPLGEVSEILGDLRRAGCRVWVAGGWGVDALVGHQTRLHRDLDLAVDARDEATAVAVLEGRGYQVETDWRPVRVELTNPGVGWVDVHPVAFNDNTGHGRQAGLDRDQFDYPPDALTTGSLDGVKVQCLSAQQQIAFHRGYAPRPVDLHDLQILASLDPASPRPVEVEVEQALAGGNASGPVVRVGDTVRKPWTSATPSVLSFVEAIRAAGVDAPAPMGRDEAGRQVQELVPGRLAMDSDPLSLPELHRVGALVRAIHDASSDYVPPAYAVWETAITAPGDDLVCHNDLAPWNLIVGERRVFIDWDAAAPSTRLWDLAYAAQTFTLSDIGLERRRPRAVLLRSSTATARTIGCGSGSQTP